MGAGVGYFPCFAVKCGMFSWFSCEGWDVRCRMFSLFCREGWAKCGLFCGEGWGASVGFFPGFAVKVGGAGVGCFPCFALPYFSEKTFMVSTVTGLPT